MAVVVIRECQLGLLQLDNGKVSGANAVVDAGQFKRELLVGQQTDATVVAGTGEDGNLEAGRIGVEIAFV